MPPPDALSVHVDLLTREVVASLIDEYKACESADYINWGMGGGAAATEGGAAGAEGRKEPSPAT